MGFFGGELKRRIIHRINTCDCRDVRATTTTTDGLLYSSAMKLCGYFSLSISFTLINFNEETMKWNCFQVFIPPSLPLSHSHFVCIFLPSPKFNISNNFFLLKKRFRVHIGRRRRHRSRRRLRRSFCLPLFKSYFCLRRRRRRKKQQHIKNYIHWPLLLFESGKNTILLSDLSASLWRCFYMNAGRVWSLLILSYTHDVFNDDNNKNHLKEPKKGKTRRKNQLERE